MTEDEIDRERAKLDYAACTAEALKRLGYQISVAQMIFRTLIFVNAGALIALFLVLGSAGSTKSAGLTMDPTRLWLAFVAFAAGLSFAMVAGICGFLTQRSYYDLSHLSAAHAKDRIYGVRRALDVRGQAGRGDMFLLATITLSTLAMLSFITGAGIALAGVLPGG